MSAFRSMSVLAIAETPPAMAYDRGVDPELSFTFTSAPRARRYSATSSRLFWMATISGVC